MRHPTSRIKLLLPFLVLLALGLGVQTNRAEQLGAARLSSVSGSGVALLQIDYETGRVKSFRILESTGNPTLDAAAAKAFAQHPFKPRTYRRPLRAPIAFTLTRRTVVSSSTTATANQPPARRHIAEMPATPSVKETRRTAATAQKLASR